MAQINDGTKSVSSPVSTGGGGTTFEQHVNGLLLSILLVNGVLPVISNCSPIEVDLQSEHKGWHTDDALLVGKTAAGKARRLAIQVKRSFTVSSTNDDCFDAIKDFWLDFRNSTLFDRASDALVLVIQRGTEVLLGGLGSLLDCARASVDSADFTGRLAAPGFLSKVSIGHAGAIREIVTKVTGSAIDDQEFWEFLRAFHLLSYDLATSTSQTEAWVKTMLAHTATGTHKRDAANATWHELVVFASQSMPNAASITRDSLPQSCRDRHSVIPDSSTAALARLRGHTSTVERGIRTEIGGGFELKREAVISELAERARTSKVILVTAPAGFGKSAVTKRAIERLTDAQAFAFRSEEFSTPHLDATLTQAQIGMGAQELFGLLAGQGRKIIHVESVERLLESTQRESFLDLLRLVGNDSNACLILTCRDYSFETVKSAFIDFVGLPCEVVQVPELEQSELEAVVSAVPALKSPSSHPYLGKLFRNPYYLDKAAKMSWPDGGSLPANERAFRDKFWREVVRRDDQAGAARPKRREDAFSELCIRRAKILEPYARCGDLDREVLDLLRADNLIVYADHTDLLAAPAHDALEDWAIVRWIDSVFALKQTDLNGFASELGTYPAIRRAFRKWLSEFLEVDAVESDQFVVNVVKDPKLPLYFRDDTLVSAISAPTAANFLQRVQPALLENGAALLKRVIHLLRVACKTTAPWLKNSGAARSVYLVPTGPAWPAVLKIINNSIAQFVKTDTGLLIGLLTDWVSGVTWNNPQPEGIQDAAQIAFQLLPLVEKYGRESPLKELFGVIVKIPMGDEKAFRSLCKRAGARDNQDYQAREFCELILTGVESGFACRDVPDAVIELANSYFRESSNRDEGRFGYRELEMENPFGLSGHLNFRFHPASASRGPFYGLLFHHPNKAVDFILDLMNYACDTFSKRHSLPGSYVDGPDPVVLQFADGTTQTQWCDERLWNLYRGTSTGPNVLQSGLMALETWLFNIGEVAPQHLEGWLMKLLKGSNNVAITAVVASVALAYPSSAGKAALALLSCPAIIRLDKQRLVHDQSPPSRLFQHFPTARAMDRIYNEERLQSDNRNHRKKDLEWLAIDLAATPLRDDVYNLLDAHRSALPSEDKQDDEDRLWRIALHRMDFRRFRVLPDDHPMSVAANADASGSSSKKIVLSPVGLEADLETYIQQDAPDRDQYLRGTNLFMWAHINFEREKKEGYPPEAWRDRLNEAKTVTNGADRKQLDRTLGYRDAPGFVAAVCVRDHWNEMDSVDHHWCIDELAHALLRGAGKTDIHSWMSLNPMDSSRAAAYVLPFLLSFNLDPSTRKSVADLVVLSLSHPVREVIHYAAAGIGNHLGKANPVIAEQLISGFASKSKWIQAQTNTDGYRRNPDRPSPAYLQEQSRPILSAAFASGDRISKSQLDALNLADWWGSEALQDILVMSRHLLNNSAVHHAHTSAALVLAQWWEAQAKHDRPDQHDYKIEHAIEQELSEFLIQLPSSVAVTIMSPILDLLAKNPDEVEGFVKQLIIAADRSGHEQNFWRIWDEFAKRIVGATWLKNLDTRSKDWSNILSAMFLGITWKEGVRHWQRLDGFAHLIDEFFRALPAKPTVFRYYLNFLFEIGERSLPQAFEILAGRLSAGNASVILADSNSRFMLEGLLRPYVYGQPMVLKTNSSLRSSVLILLDELVSAGSFVAYRMRDDFVTPTS